jgi:hypothetical protein
LIEKSLEVHGRTFHMLFIRATNGAVLLLYEGSDPTLGAVTASIKTPLGVHSQALTPGRKEDILSRTLGEMLANQVQGFVISSFYVRRVLEPETSLELIRKVKGLLSELS